MLLRLFRWFWGYVKFVAMGDKTEKFINLTVRKGINLWDMRKTDGNLTAKCIVSEYKCTRPIAKKAGVKVKILEKHGFPFFMFKYRKRSGIIIGMALFIGILYSLSFYIWEVNVEGNQLVPTQEIKAAMEELGVSSGSLKSRIDVPIVQQSAMLKLPGVSWISLNIEGSNAVVSVKERIVPPELVPKGNPCNIKACIDAQIERVETYKGTAAINQGDAVVKGQLLISGVVEDANGENSFVHADGKVFARTKRKLIEDVELSKVTSVDTGKMKKRHKIKIIGIEIPISIWRNIDENYRVETIKNVMRIHNLELPIVVYTELCYEQLCDEKIISYDEALSEAKQKIEHREQNELRDKKILSRDEKNCENNGKCHMEVEYVCVENIAEQEEIIFE